MSFKFPSFKMGFVKSSSAGVSAAQAVIRRIGDAIIGGDFSGQARGQWAIDIQILRAEIWNVASGFASMAFGKDTTASGINSQAFGAGNTASGDNSVAMGNQATATGEEAVAVGTQADALANNAVAVGSGAAATALRATALGYGAQAVNADEAVIGCTVLKTQNGITKRTVMHQGDTAGGDLAGTYPNPTVALSIALFDTKTNILAATPTARKLAFSTDTFEMFVANGVGWYLLPFPAILEPAAPDMGYTQASARIGMAQTYITDKSLNYTTVGQSANAEAGAIRTTATGKFQVYLNGVWNDIVINFVFREDATFGYTFEHAPVGFTNYIEIMTGQSLNNLGLNGLPLVNAYKTSMGAYPCPAKIGGRTI